MSKLFKIFLMMLLVSASSISTFAQAISGPTTADVGQQTVHVYTVETMLGDPYWMVSGGYIVAQSYVYPDFYVTVEWTDAGTGQLDFYDVSTVMASHFVMVTGYQAPIPNAVTSIVKNCDGNTVITRSNNPPANVRWYWQTTSAYSTDESLGYAQQLTLTTGSYQGMYYLRGKNMSAPVGSDPWSVTVQEIGVAELAVTPSVPTVPIHGQRKGPGTIAISTEPVPSATSYKWYSQNAPGGVADAQQTTNYFLFQNLTATTTKWVSALRGSCESGRLSVTASILPNPVITVSGSDILTGPSIALSTQSFTSYTWRYADGTVVGTTQTVNVGAAGLYTVEVTDATGTSTSEPFLVRDLLDSQNKTFVISTQLTKAGVKDVSHAYSLPKEARLQGVQYLDGMGKTMQSVSMQMSPGGKDIIMPMDYDNLSRPAAAYLPMAGEQGTGMYQSGILGAGTYVGSPHYNYYNVGSANNSGVARDPKPYSKSTYDNSPLSRITQVGSYGQEWQPEILSTTIVPGTNAAGEVRKWTITSNVPTSSSSYTAGLLSLTSSEEYDSEDATSLGMRKVWTDAQGQKILERTRKTTSSTIEWLETYYIYDGKGNVQFILPPALMAELGTSGNPSASQLDRWAFQYRYDEFNRMIEQRAPGGNWIYVVYDKRNRIVMTRDANQVLRNEWSFIKYDAFDRPVVTGLYKPTINYTRTQVQAMVDASNAGKGFTNTNAPEYGMEHVTTGTSLTLQTQHTNTAVREQQATTSITLKPGFSCAASNSISLALSLGDGTAQASSAFPDKNVENLTMNYYDKYPTGTLLFPWATFQFETQTWTDIPGAVSYNMSDRTRGLLTGSRQLFKDVSGISQWLNTITYYDKSGRSIQTITQNHVAGLNKLSQRFNFNNNVVESILTHSDNKVSSDQRLVERFEYDHALRLVRTFSKVNNQPEVLVASNTYNELGDVINVRLHSTDNGATYLQSVDFSRNIKGWLTHINQTPNSDGIPDYLTLELAYNSVLASGNTDRKDGLITATRWKDDISNRSHYYNLKYDALKQLTEAVYKSNSGTWQNTDRFSEKGIDYDKNGNIKTLQRYAGGMIDDLAYDYGSGSISGNRLRAVTDYSTQVGFNDGNTSGEDYVYDTQGNLTADKNKDIAQIDYNYLNLPSKIRFDDNSYMLYAYDQGGVKLQEAYFNASNQLQYKSDYDGEFMYKNDTLAQITTVDGHLSPDYFEGAFEYYYYLTDQVGSPRIVLQSDMATMEVTATMENVNTAAEETQFLFYDDAIRINSDIFDNTYNGTTGATYYSTRLAGTSTERYGLTRSLSVMPGDVVNVEVYAKYLDPNSSNWTTALTNFMAAIAGGTAPAGTFIDGNATGSIGNQTFPYPGLVNRDGDNTIGPKAYLNYILFDRNFGYITSGFRRLSENAKETGTNVAHERLAFDNIIVQQAGYIYIYLSNENDTPVEVYFDDFNVEHIESAVAQINGYYPYGMTAYSYSREDQQEVNRYFQGKSFDPKTQYHDFQARQYDAALARWFMLDPANQFLNPLMAMLNNPLVHVDPNGEFIPILIGLGVGLITGYIGGRAAGLRGRDLFFYTVGSGIIGGLSGGAGSVVGNTVTSATGSAFVGAVVGGAVGGAVSGSFNAAMNGGDFGRGAWQGALGGAVGGAIGLNMPGIIPGAVVGAVSGGLIGGGMAELFGGNFSDGFKYGAISGGISGGIYGGFKAASSSYERSIMFGTYTRDGKTAALKDAAVGTGVNNIEIKKMANNAETRPIVNGQEMSAKDGILAGAPVGTRSNVYMRANRSLRAMLKTLNHELVHVGDFYTGRVVAEFRALEATFFTLDQGGRYTAPETTNAAAVAAMKMSEVRAWNVNISQKQADALQVQGRYQKEYNEILYAFFNTWWP